MRLLILTRFCVLATSIAIALPAQQGQLPVSPAPTAMVEQRVALLIGNGAYKSAPLKSPVNDVRTLSEILRGCGFQVTSLENAGLPKMRQALREFGGQIAKGGVGFFYFGGHGLQVKGKNYLIPTDADIQAEDEVPSGALDLESVLAKMEASRNRMNVMVVDACRSNPFARTFKVSVPGLAPVEAPVGTFVGLAASPGRTVADDREGNGIYAEQLIEALRTPGLKLEEAFKRVQAGVRRTSNNAQVPWSASRVEVDFAFNTGAPLASAVVKPEPPPIVQVPVGKAAGERWTDPGSGIELVWVPAGNFVMGANRGAADEKPRRLVAISRGFWMGKYEVTQKQYEAVMGLNPSKFLGAGPNAPVEQVTWNETKAFLARLNQKSGKTLYRLPTEAEWEYACWAGITVFDKDALDSMAWFKGNSGKTTHSVGKFRPNPWGLHDMLGNVWEWCEDRYAGKYDTSKTSDPTGPATGNQRVSRGGAWDSIDKDLTKGNYTFRSIIASPNYGAKILTPTVRLAQTPDTRADNLGFRVVVLP